MNRQLLQIKQGSGVIEPFSSFLSSYAMQGFGDLYYINQQAKGFRVFIDQATPGFELGKKDLQSPALPLGHAAKTIKIDGNIP